MAGQELNAVLRRKAREGRQEQQARAMSPVKALRLALAKAADDAFNLDLRVSDAEAEEVAGTEVAKGLDDSGLLLLLEGRGGYVGAMTLDRTVVAALVEHQTIGKVVSRDAGDRRATRVDAAMAAPLVDLALTRFEAMLAGERESIWAEGYRFGAMVDDLRGLGLALEAHEYHLFHMQLELGGGAKSGKLALVLPNRARPAPIEDEAAEEPEDEDRDGASAVLEAPVEMTAVLARISLPFDELRALRPGKVLTLAGDALHQTALEAGQGQRVAEVTLGQLNGFRAVRLGAGRPPRANPDALEALPEPPVAATVVAQEGPETVQNPPPVPEVDGLPAATATDAPGAEAEMVADVAAMPEVQELSGFDDLSDLEDLPDLSDLPDLADVPALDDALVPVGSPGE